MRIVRSARMQSYEIGWDPKIYGDYYSQGTFQKSELAGRTMAGPDILAMN